jgi:hypothetical protein
MNEDLEGQGVQKPPEEPKTVKEKSRSVSMQGI